MSGLEQTSYAYHAFVSYNSADKEWCREIVVGLRKKNLRVFFDEDSIVPGDSIPDRIELGLQTSRHIVLVFSPEALQSNWMVLEYTSRLFNEPSTKNRPLIPVLRQDCKIPFLLSQIKYIDARDEDLARHIHEIFEAIERTDLPPLSSEPEPISPKRIYHIGGGVPEDEFFFGRENELGLIRQHLPGNFLVSGGRMQGKTSLLKAIKRRSSSWGFHPHYIHLREHELIGQIDLLLAENRQASDRPILVLVDEADELAELPAPQGAKIVQELESRYQSPSGPTVSFILAGGWRLVQMAQGKPFDNFGPHLVIGALEETAAAALARQPERYGFQYESHQVFRQVLVESGRQPHLICLICHGMIQALQQRTQSEKILRAEDLRKALLSTQVREKFYGWRERIEAAGWPSWAIGVVEVSAKNIGAVGSQQLMEHKETFAPTSEAIDHLLGFLAFQGWLQPTKREREYFHLPVFKREAHRATGSLLLRSAKRRFKVALSFPGQHRHVVEQIANGLVQRLGKDSVFYDHFYEHELARPQLITYLQNIYLTQSDLIVPFVSANYDASELCILEWDKVLELIKKRREDAIMIFRLDNSEIPGLLTTTGYISVRSRSSEEIVELITKRYQLLEDTKKRGL